MVCSHHAVLASAVRRAERWRVRSMAAASHEGTVRPWLLPCPFRAPPQRATTEAMSSRPSRWSCCFVGLVPTGRSQAFAEQFPHGRFIAHPEEHWKPPYSHVTRSIQTIDEFFGPVPVANEALLPINAATLTPRERKCSAC